METALRPLTLGEILDRAAQLYRDRFLLFAGIFAVYAGVVTLLNLPLIFLLHANSSQRIPRMPAGPPSLSQAPHIWSIFLALGLAMLLFVLLYGAATAAITRAVAWVHLGEPASIGRAYSTTLPRLGVYIWLKIVIGVLIFLACMGALLVAAMVAVAAAALLRRSGAWGGGLLVLIVLWIYLAPGVLGAIMALRYSLAIPACVVESLTARRSLRRSIELSKGSRGRIFVLWIMVGVIWAILFALAHSFFFFYSATHQNTLPVGFSILEQILNFFVITLVGPLLAAGTTLFYYDQRVRKEGYDIEWMMQAAGRAGRILARNRSAPSRFPPSSIWHSA